MEYYYTESENIDFDNNCLILKDFEYKHLVKVLRKQNGEEINVTDGKKNIFRSKIIKITRNEIICSIIEKKFNLHEPYHNLILFVSPLRNLSRFEFVIEKAVELGVNKIYPVITEYTVNKSKFNKTKIERINKIIISAMGQAQRCFLTEFFNTISFREMLNYTGSCPSKIVMYEHEKSDLKLEKIPVEEVCLLVGPEGGFSKEEMDILIKNKWQPKSLGERKLRSETAAIVSVYDILK